MIEEAWARLSAADLATWSELADPEGPWSVQMLELGLGEALAIEMKRRKAQYEATEAAIGSAFSKGKVGRIYSNSIDDVLLQVNSGRRQARGLAPEQLPNRDVDELRRAFGRGRKRR